MYYKAKKLALQNGCKYHLAAVLVRRKSIMHIGYNTKKTHPTSLGRERYLGRHAQYHTHAEQSALRFAKPGDILYVLRFTDGGNISMAAPCQHCQELIRRANLKRVFYTDRSGEFRELQLHN